MLDCDYSGGTVTVYQDSIEIKKFKNPYSCGISNYSERKGKDFYNENNEFEKLNKNIKRAQQNIRDIINSNLTPHTKFLTLTCRENVLEYKKIKRMFTTFLQAMKRDGYTLRYLGVLEHQKERGLKNGDEGAYHIHLIVFNDENIPYQIINKHWDGFTHIKVCYGLRVKDKKKIDSVAWYVCKYITKENYTEYSSHVYFCSKGLIRPVKFPIPVYKFNDEYEIDKESDYYIGVEQIKKNYKFINYSTYEFNIPQKYGKSITQKIITQRGVLNVP